MLRARRECRHVEKDSRLMCIKGKGDRRADIMLVFVSWIGVTLVGLGIARRHSEGLITTLSHSLFTLASRHS
jgi:hypothetical protein